MPRRLLKNSFGTPEDDKLKHVPHCPSTAYNPEWGMLQLAEEFFSTVLGAQVTSDYRRQRRLL